MKFSTSLVLLSSAQALRVKRGEDPAPAPAPECTATQRLIDNACVDNTCVCLNGNPVATELCLSNGNDVCDTCDPGYKLNAGHCAPIVCDAKYHLVDSTCVLNTCSCPNGTPRVECHEDGAAGCDACNANFHLNVNVCDANVCKCDNGNAVSDCVNNGEPKCESCNTGFRLNGGHCEPIICSADKHLDGDDCVTNVCLCENGTPHEVCYTHNEVSCKSCDATFNFADGGCVANVCTCENGDLTTECTVNGAVMCSACDDGYKLEPGMNGWCMEVKCHPHEHRVGENCVQNLCTCENGSAFQGGPCSEDGMAKCEYCDAGYRKVGDACVEME